jgi:UDP-N-acetylmuramoyl-L-alanyl-D-glutamate--2,6-diaminopimelate ligase
VIALERLLAPWSELTLHDSGDATIDRVVEDSREAGPGALFVAVAGHGADGHDYVSSAIAAGATAILVATDRYRSLRAALPDNHPVAWVTASRTRGLPARLARECEGRPDLDLRTVGVTGTNGKTTTAFLLQELLRSTDGSCGLLGTIRYDDGQRQQTAPLTTPGGPVLYRWLARMRDAGTRAAAMEISSHALDQGRAADLELDAALLTNLGRDHLDYHGDMETYRSAKLGILALLGGERRAKPPGVAVINVADPAFASVTSAEGETVRFSADPDVAADLQLRAADLSLSGTRLHLDWRGRELELTSPLVGRFNADNLTAALAVGLGLGVDPVRATQALAGVRQVPGRLEQFRLPVGALAVVDYAHTHDALAAVLRTCDELSTGRLAVVFGCGGDRDRGKRPLMGQVAAELADVAWITSDNPRSEPPDRICREIEAGFATAASPRASGREVIVDRTEAIEAALTAAGPGDVVVIAGKGHEDYQIVGERRLHLDDREIVSDWIARSDHGA